MADDAKSKKLVILKEIAELLNEGTEMDQVLKEVLKKLLHVTGLKTGWIFLIDGNGKYQMVAYEALPPALAQKNFRRMCEGDCWCVNRYRNQKLKKATNIIECQRIETAIEENAGATCGLSHHATVPLGAGNERFGLLNVGSPNKTYFEPEELALLEAVALQVGTALKRIQLTQQEQEHALVTERNRLARDLHDSVNQLLFSLNLTARAGVELTDTEEVKQTFRYIQDLAQDALGEMRALIWQLRPQGLENGIANALSSYGDMIGLEVDTKVSGIICIPGKMEEALWRIGQEALANCKKHAQSTKTSLRLKSYQHNVTMIIEDQGCGFHYNETLNLPSLGLKNMKERTESLNGSFSLESIPGKGTKIEVNIPI
ncbi:GAF domain-containing sensor histidine kinase [Mesobacillus maritimus]|uniref:GAF domain-containing sensor histidine kinase n=1 Tax=Mesobacillus maritimus TaxID=1643336 RepID=UPI0020420960|nr:GAF domain-containing sensor histidine kinase [Mesobacillus maritimus]MCM3584483.1 GAF domain-containing sensor histidine kinase [Mesobacillus maritimus]MCM3670784.1 GAF domain-containing sensor histidine kinase [Mesobacillus maritimus]